jgi:NAD(P)-dependent dehydrogenase (short-subunit alcohol dehydrogenase family)
MAERRERAGRFAGRVVIITGGSKGIGAGCARVFCAEGGLVVICARGEAEGQRQAEELTAQGPGTCHFERVDVRQPDELKAVIDGTVERYDRLDCLINNAGWHPNATDNADVSIADFEDLVRLNLTSTFAGCKYALPYLRQTRGTIVNMASMVGLLGQALAAAYCATKAGQIGLTKALAVDYAPHGVRVNAVCPAGVDTPLLHEWAATLPDPAAGLRRVDEMHKLGRMATPEEIGRVCLFLATEDSAFVTGQAIPVEGGASLDY